MSHNTLLSKQGDKKDKKAHDRKASTEGAPADKAEKTDKSAKCAYCGKAGHNILVCFKLIAVQAAAKSDGTHNKKIAAAISTRVTEDMEEETGFTCYPAITRTLIPVEQLKIILKNPTISTSNLNVFTAGSQSNLSWTDVILDTGANVASCTTANYYQTCLRAILLLSMDLLILPRKDPWVAYVMPTITRILLPIFYQRQLSLARVIYSHMTTLLTHSPSVIQEDYLYSPGVTMDYMYVTSVTHMFS